MGGLDFVARALEWGHGISHTKTMAELRAIYVPIAF